jgi:NAD(P)-dependent dehydrogenase (short-subunit alcohol dehydrogenase family)
MGTIQVYKLRLGDVNESTLRILSTLEQIRINTSHNRHPPFKINAITMSSNVTSTKIWFITGASSGLGLQLAFSALREGHRVIGTGRNTASAAAKNPDFEKLGGQWLQLDLTKSTATKTIQDALEKEDARLSKDGPVHWVVVNNAGYALVGPAEEASEALFTDYFEANIHGVVRVWRAALPILRRRRAGTLITISSLYGFLPKPEQMMYSAAKATAESLTEAYGELLAPLGIKTLVVRPGAFRTSFAANSAKTDLTPADDYKKTFDAWQGLLDWVVKDPTVLGGDPERFGPALVDAVLERGVFAGMWTDETSGKAFVLQLGSDSNAAVAGRVAEMHKQLERTADISKSTDFPGTVAKSWN